MINPGVDIGPLVPRIYQSFPYCDPCEPWIFGYPKRGSVFQGDSITFCYLTNLPKFRVWLYRVGAVDPTTGSALSPLYSPQDWQLATASTDGIIRPQNADQDPSADWQWPSVEVKIDPAWPPGVYVAMFHAADINKIDNSIIEKVGPAVKDKPLWSPFTDALYDPTTPVAQSAKALFVVRAPIGKSSAKIVYNLSLATFHAYNATGNVNMYQGWNGNYTGALRITMQRPGGGTGGWFTAGYVFPCGFENSEFNSFSRWGFNLIRWLEGWLADTGGGQPALGTDGNYGTSPVDYCTDVDLHLDDQFLSGYKLMLFAGHCEYWSTEMRAHTEQFVATGGNVAFFSGDNLGWHISFEDEDGDGYPDAFACTKHLSQPLPVKFFGDKGAMLFGDDSFAVIDPLRPESLLTGPSTRNGAVHLAGGGPSLGYIVQHADSWVYSGTGLTDGSVLGANIQLVNYEVDGIQSQPDPLFSSDPDREGFLSPSGVDGAALNFVILGNCPLTLGGEALTGWETFELTNPASWSPPAATMGYYSKADSGGGTVFNAGTTDWVLALGSASGRTSQLLSSDPRSSDVAAVATITANVIEKLSAG